MKTGVIVGRFQVPYLHDGHRHLIDHVWKECDKLVFILGTSTSIDERNPLDFHIRADMLKEYMNYQDEVYIYDLQDRESDKEWSDYLDRLLDSLEGGIFLYGSRDCFKDHYHGKYEVIDVPELEGHSGTKMRDEISYYSSTSSEDFRAGIIYGVIQLLKNQSNESN